MQNQNPQMQTETAQASHLDLASAMRDWGRSRYVDIKQLQKNQKGEWEWWKRTNEWQGIKSKEGKMGNGRQSILGRERYLHEEKQTNKKKP